MQDSVELAKATPRGLSQTTRKQEDAKIPTPTISFGHLGYEDFQHRPHSNQRNQASRDIVSVNQESEFGRRQEELQSTKDIQLSDHCSGFCTDVVTQETRDRRAAELDCDGDSQQGFIEITLPSTLQDFDPTLCLSFEMVTSSPKINEERDNGVYVLQQVRESKFVQSRISNRHLREGRCSQNLELG